MKAEGEAKIVPMDSSDIPDRIRLCWGHLENWEDSKTARNCKEWLERSNGVFKPTTFLAYVDTIPVGMVEFIPQRFVRQVGLCPCRIDSEHGEVENRYDLGKEYDDFLFISCLYVSKDYQGRGIGGALLSHFLNSRVFQNSKGAFVYVAEKYPKWESYVHWPTGPKEFYLKAGFEITEVLGSPSGYVMTYSKAARN